MKTFPFISEELIKALETAFPDKAPRKLTEDVTAYAALVGQQQVMDLLRSRYASQQRTERSL